MIRNKVINIDSYFRDKTRYPNSADFTLQLPVSIKPVFYIRLSSIELPNVFYTFKEKINNYFTIKYKIGSALYVKIIEIPPGNYTALQIIESINTQLLNKATTPDHSIKVLFDPYTYKITFINDPLKTGTFTIEFPKSSKSPSLGYMLGFTQTVYFDMSIYVSELVLNLSSKSYVFLKVNDYGRVSMNPTNDLALAKIILNKSKADMIYDNCSNYITKTHIFEQPITVFNFKIQIVDYNNNVLDLNGMDFSCTLEIGHSPIQHMESLLDFN